MDPVLSQDFQSKETAINEAKFYRYNPNLIGFVQDQNFKMIDQREPNGLYQQF